MGCPLIKLKSEVSGFAWFCYYPISYLTYYLIYYIVYYLMHYLMRSVIWDDVLRIVNSEDGRHLWANHAYLTDTEGIYSRRILAKPSISSEEHADNPLINRSPESVKVCR